MPHQQVTLAQLRASLQTTWEGVPFWTDTEATRALQEALRTWNLLTGQWRRLEILPAQVGEHLYALSSTMILPGRVNFSSYPLDMSSVPALNNGRPAWRGETAGSSGVPSRPSLWAPVGLARIAVWPAPASAEATFVVDGVRETPTLAADSDYVDLGQEEMGVIISEALHIAAFKEGGARWKATQSYHQDFLRSAAGKNGRLFASSLFRKAMGLDDGRGRKRLSMDELAEQGRR
jgi:hypothetical protein